MERARRGDVQFLRVRIRAREQNGENNLDGKGLTEAIHHNRRRDVRVFLLPLYR